MTALRLRLEELVSAEQRQTKTNMAPNYIDWREVMPGAVEQGKEKLPRINIILSADLRPEVWSSSGEATGRVDELKRKKVIQRSKEARGQRRGSHESRKITCNSNP